MGVRGLFAGASTVVIMALVLMSWVTGGAAMADTIFLSEERSLEGEVIHTDDNTVVVRLATGGTMALPKSGVLRITKGEPSPAEVLPSLEKRLPPHNAAALYQLALWCEEQGLAADATRLAWQTLEVERNHYGARHKLGFRVHDNRWFAPGDFEVAEGKRPFGGEWLAGEEIEARLSAAHGAAYLTEARALFDTALGDGDMEARRRALASFQALASPVRAWIATQRLGAPRWKERLLAVRELAAVNDVAQRPVLSCVAVLDERRAVRDEALRTLKAWNDPDTALSFLPFLEHSMEPVRTSAANALGVFPDRRSVSTLVETSQAVWAGFGRVHMSQLVQRAYVQDYELVSGGTGLIVQEVADPVVGTFQDGVVLDVQVRRVLAESSARAAALRRISGRHYGASFPEWDSWWHGEAGKKQLAQR